MTELLDEQCWNDEAWLEAETRRLELQQIIFRPMVEWLEKVHPTWNWRWAWSLDVQKHLELQALGRLPKLMLSAPVRHGKSQLATIHYAVWRLAADPTLRIAIACYNSTFAKMFGRATLALAKSAGIAMNPGVQAAEYWETAAGGGIMSVGVGTGLAGRGFDLLILDDPIKLRKEAQSETVRETIWQWWKSDLYTRAEPGASFMFSMARWHEDDLIGRLLKSEDAEGWKYLNYPMEAELDDPLGREPGEPLCPERFDRAKIAEMKRVMQLDFFGLCQGRPTNPEGSRFSRKTFRYFELVRTENETYLALHKPDGVVDYIKQSECYTIQFLDLAGTIKEKSDYTVILTCIITPSMDICAVNCTREKVETTNHESLLLNEVKRWKPAYIGIEDKQFGTNLIQSCIKQGLPAVAESADTDKLMRSWNVHTRFLVGAVYFLLGAQWLSVVEDELLGFPDGAHDDIVDCFSLVGIHVANYACTMRREATKPEPEDTRLVGSILARMNHNGELEEPYEYV